MRPLTQAQYREMEIILTNLRQSLAKLTELIGDPDIDAGNGKLWIIAPDRPGSADWKWRKIM